MAKNPTPYRISDEAKLLLKKLCELDDRKPSNMLEKLIIDEAKRKGIK